MQQVFTAWSLRGVPFSDALEEPAADRALPDSLEESEETRQFESRDHPVSRK